MSQQETLEYHEKLLTIKELAELYGISIWSIYQNIRRFPEFPAINLGPKKSYRVRPVDFEAWLRRRQFNHGQGYYQVPTAQDILGMRPKRRSFSLEDL